MLEAVRRNGLALRHASSALRAERDVVLTAIRDCPMALEHAHAPRTAVPIRKGPAQELLRKDPDFVIAALRISVRCVKGISAELLADEAYGLRLLELFPSAFPQLSQELRASRAPLLHGAFPFLPAVFLFPFRFSFSLAFPFTVPSLPPFLSRGLPICSFRVPLEIGRTGSQLAQDFVLRAVGAKGEVLRYAAGWHCDTEVALTAIRKAFPMPKRP